MPADERQVTEKKERDAWRARPEHWLGLFYYNRKDKAMFVRGRYGLNYTLNFANPWAYFALVILISVIEGFIWIIGS